MKILPHSILGNIFNLNKKVKNQIQYTTFVTLILLVLKYFILLIFTYLPSIPKESIETINFGVEIILIGLVSSIIITIIEEFVFRYFIPVKNPKYFYIIVSAILFSLVHFPFIGVDFFNFQPIMIVYFIKQFTLQFAYGIFFGVIRVKVNFWYSCITHEFINIVQYITYYLAFLPFLNINMVNIVIVICSSVYLYKMAINYENT
jgi:membrane protease YdiL (CAAX protease family)